MRIDGFGTTSGTAGLPLDGKKPQNPEAAARQFEEILVKQMIQTMTKGLFDGGLMGDDAPQWTGAYGEMQSDVLSTELAKQLTAGGKLGIAELLLKQWERQGDVEPSPEESDPTINASKPETGSINPYREA